MAIIFADGFEDWTSQTGEYEVSVGTTTPSSTQARRGGFAAFISNGNNYIGKTLPSALTEVFASVAIYPTTSAVAAVSFMSSTTAQVTIRINADGTIEARRGIFSGTLLGSSSAGAAPQNQFTHLQIRVVISDTVGVVQVRVNGSGSNAISLTGQDTNNGAAAVSCDQVRLGGNGTSQSIIGYYDDFVVWDTTGSVANTWLGDTRVDTYFPNGNGDSSQFVGSDGNSTDNYLLVDASAPNGTDYVQSDVVSNKDLYAFQNMSHTPSAIYGVLATGSVLKDDAGSRDIRLLAKTSSTEVEGSTITLSTSRTRVRSLFETDPTTAAAWTKSGIDGAQFGIKVQA